MGRQLPVENRFRERVKQERDRRGWSQADLSKLLRQRKGLEHIYPTTVAKIESGERAVRIIEANALGDLFEVSVDVLLGRSTNPSNDQAYALRVLADTANRSAYQVHDIAATLIEQLQDVKGHETLQAGHRAWNALRDANAALVSIARLVSDDPQPATWSRAMFEAEESRNAGA